MIVIVLLLMEWPNLVQIFKAPVWPHRDPVLYNQPSAMVTDHLKR